MVELLILSLLRLRSHITTIKFYSHYIIRCKYQLLTPHATLNKNGWRRRIYKPIPCSWNKANDDDDDADKIPNQVVSRPLFGQSLKYSTKISGDSDTHEDFRSINKLENSGISVLDVVQQDIKINPVMIYMKGVPDAPRCGFSALAVKVLQQYGVPISSRNILEDPVLKEGVKAFSNWPTFPQIFVKGEFIGGSDIVLNMHQNGQLKELLSDIKGDNAKPSGD